mgnify:CR=1 FL=1
MRSVWTGTINYANTEIPVKAYIATDEHGTRLHQLHAEDGGRVRTRRVCEIDGAEVPYSDIAKGYELPGGGVVVLTDEDFAALPEPTPHAIEVCAFTPFEQIDPIHFVRSYYLEPEAIATRPYVLLAEALHQSGRVAVVKVAIRQRETLGVLRVHDQVLVLATMLWPDEIRTPDFPFLHEDVDLRLPELRKVIASIEELSGNFEPAQYTDRYQDALDELIAAKVARNEVLRPSETGEKRTTADLVSALRGAAAGTEADPRRGAQRRAARREAAVRDARSAAARAAAARAEATRAATESRPGVSTRR